MQHLLLNHISLVIPGVIEPWPERQPEESKNLVESPTHPCSQPIPGEPPLRHWRLLANRPGPGNMAFMLDLRPLAMANGFFCQLALMASSAAGHHCPSAL